MSNGLQSSYSAQVNDGHIATIDELRSAPDHPAAHGSYSFYGARLVRYTGDGITDTAHEEVEFDLHGAIKRSRSGAGSVSDTEIGAIRNRAELLRSHALTQMAVQAHQPN